MFEYQYEIKLNDTDAAGVLFFASQFDIIHRAYEELLGLCKYPIRRILDEGNFALPIVRAESDFLAPVRVGDIIDIHINLESVSASSFILNYKILNTGKICGKARTVHVSIGRADGKKTSIPSDLKMELEKFL